MVLLSSGCLVVHPHGFTPRRALLGPGVGVSFLGGPGPHHPRAGEPGPCLFFLSSRLQNAHRHLRRASPNLRWGAEVTSHKTCTFLRTNMTQLHKGPAAAPFQKPRPPSRRVLPDLFGADLPKAMPYWFCTNRVHLRVLCLPGVHYSFSCFPHQSKQG